MGTKHPKITKVKSHSCSLCDFTTHCKTSIYNHKVKHEGKFKCSKCNKIFGSAYKLQRHTKVHDRIKCEICERAFTCIENLEKHRSLFNNKGCQQPQPKGLKEVMEPKTYECTKCAKSFPNGYKLDRPFHSMTENVSIAT